METVEAPQLPFIDDVSAHELTGCFLGALHTGAGPGAVSTGTRPPILGGFVGLVGETLSLNRQNHHHHQCH